MIVTSTRRMMNAAQDVRSLAALRILVGLYIVYDILSRLQHGRLSLLWYTSSDGAFLRPDDTPHGNVIHKLWFYRGSELFQVLCFGITMILAIAFLLGYRSDRLSGILWVAVVAMQNRSMSMHDGSDTFLRHVLLWSSMLPVSAVWSLDSRRVGRPSYNTVSNAATWGLRLQIVLMYLGTVFNRTVDKFGWTEMNRSEWMPPVLSAVFYALNASFAIRDAWWGDMIRARFPLTQFMTMSSMVIESLAPCLCLLLPTRIQHIPASFLFQLHFGLLLFINLPNWQFMGMAATVVWIPPHVWDGMERTLGKRFPNHFRVETFQTPDAIKKKTDDYHDVRHGIGTDKQNAMGNRDVVGTQTKQKRHRSGFLSTFLLLYMVYNWCGHRQWVAKHDGGDIGEFLRFSQFWVMYGVPPHFDTNTLLRGRTVDGNMFNGWEWIKYRALATVAQDENGLGESDTAVLHNMTHVYPSPRWERIFNQWGGQRDVNRARYFLEGLCQFDDQPFESLELVWQHLVVNTPGKNERFAKSRPDTVIQVDCSGFRD